MPFGIGSKRAKAGLGRIEVYMLRREEQKKKREEVGEDWKKLKFQEGLGPKMANLI